MPSLLNKFINWVLYTSFFAACCATGLCMATERLFTSYRPPLVTPLHALIFGSTLLVYNVHFIFKRSSPDLSDRYGWSQYYMIWHYGAILTGIALIGTGLLFLPLKIWLACGVLGLLSFAYSIPLLPLRNKKRIKDFGWIKLFTLVSVWTIVTAVLPILYWDKQLGAYPFEILIRFIFMLALCIAFDIRDMQTDMDASIYTLPNSIGVKNSYRLIHIAIVLFAILSVVQYIRYPSLQRLSAEMITAITTMGVIHYTKRHPSDRVYLALVDGMMLLYAVLILI